MPDTARVSLSRKWTEQKCISCDLCEKRCPAGREMRRSSTRELLGAQAKDEAASQGSPPPAACSRCWRAKAIAKGRRGVSARRLAKTCAWSMSARSMKRSLPACAVPRYVQSDATDAIRQRRFAAQKGVFRCCFPARPVRSTGLLAALGNTKRRTSC